MNVRNGHAHAIFTLHKINQSKLGTVSDSLLLEHIEKRKTFFLMNPQSEMFWRTKIFKLLADL